MYDSRFNIMTEKTVVKELNPDLLYLIGNSIPAGDDYCEHIYGSEIHRE